MTMSGWLSSDHRRRLKEDLLARGSDAAQAAQVMVDATAGTPASLPFEVWAHYFLNNRSLAQTVLLANQQHELPSPEEMATAFRARDKEQGA